MQEDTDVIDSLLIIKFSVNIIIKFFQLNL